MKKRIISFLLALVLAATLLPVQVWSAEKTAAAPDDGGSSAASVETLQYAGGTGTKADPFQIETAEQLFDIVHDPAAYYVLTSDIALEGTAYQTLSGGDNTVQYWGVGWNEFSGVFDGQGHTISGLRQGAKGAYREGNCFGFFRKLSGTVRNLGITDVLISVDAVDCTKELFAGGLAGECRNAVIENCFITGVISLSNAGANGVAGGLIGSATGSMIKNCYTNCQVVSDKTAGGICGFLSECGMFSCYHVGEITGKTLAGGMIGQSPAGEISDCYYYAEGVSGVGDAVVTTITACSDAEMMQQTTFSGFDFKDIWTMEGADGYPHLREKAYSAGGAGGSTEAGGSTGDEAAIVASGECGAEGDNVTWTLDDTGLLTISGTGKMKDYSGSGAPWYSWGDAIKSSVIGAGVTSIGEYAFCWCNRMSNVTIPDSVASIGAYAFSSCKSLATITIPDSVTTIKAYAFFYCGLTDVTIPKSVTSIGRGVFAGCVSLKRVQVDVDNAVYSSDGAALYTKDKKTLLYVPEGFLGHYSIIKGVTVIAAEAFSDCKELTDVMIPSGICDIGDHAFSGCSKLTGVSIPASVMSLGWEAFVDCSRLKEIKVDYGNAAFVDMDGVLFSRDKKTLICVPGGFWGNYHIPSGVTTIRKDAFSGTNLISVFIPDGITTIGERMFASAVSLTRIIVPSSVTLIEDDAFIWCDSLTDVYYSGSEAQWKAITIGRYNEDLLTATIHYNSEGPATSVIDSGECGAEGDNVTWTLDDTGLLTISGTGKMKDYSYEKPAPWNSQASIIKKVIINNDITSIGGFAFQNCYKLTGVTIPNSVKTLGTGVFWECNDLTSVTIPKGVTAIGHGTFSHCRSLKQVQVDEANTVYSSVDGVLFSKDKKTLIYCPIGFLGSYSIPNNVIEIGAEAFSRCRGLTGITISGSVKTIGADAFSDCDGLTSVTIPSGVTTIGGYAFSSCDKLAKVILPDSVVTVAIGVFLYCGSLKEIHVDVKNSVYASENGVLFTKDKKTLVRVPGGLSGSYSVPSGVTAVGYYSFGGCYDLTRVVLPHGVSCIEGSAFANCSRLTSITMPDSVTTINGAAFSACDNLTDVYYGGSEAQWKAITIDRYNEDLLAATIHYNSTGLASGVKKGDVNGDDSITAADMQRLYTHLNGTDPLSDTAAADINGDGQVTAADMQRLYTHLNGTDPLR